MPPFGGLGDRKHSACLGWIWVCPGSRPGHSPLSADGLTSARPQQQEAEWKLGAQLCPSFLSLCSPSMSPHGLGAGSPFGNHSAATCLWPHFGGFCGSDPATHPPTSLCSYRQPEVLFAGSPAQRLPPQSLAPVDVKMTFSLPPAEMVSTSGPLLLVLTSCLVFSLFSLHSLPSAYTGDPASLAQRKHICS